MRKPHRCGAATELCCASLVDQDDSDGGEMSRPERRQQPPHSPFSQVNHNTWSWGSRVAGSNPVSPTRKDRKPLSWITPSQGLLSVSSMIAKVSPLWGPSGDLHDLLHDYGPRRCCVQSFFSWARRPLRGPLGLMPLPRPSSRRASGAHAADHHEQANPNCRCPSLEDLSGQAKLAVASRLAAAACEHPIRSREHFIAGSDTSWLHDLGAVQDNFYPLGRFVVWRLTNTTRYCHDCPLSCFASEQRDIY
jgi:hypothetical protein